MRPPSALTFSQASYEEHSTPNNRTAIYVCTPMKLLRCVTTIVCILGPPFANAGEKTESGTGESGEKVGEATLPSYETAKQIRAMKPCAATVESTHGCYAVLRTADGEGFTMGGPGNTAELNRFIGTLKEGQTYKLPGFFLTYQKRHPR